MISFIDLTGEFRANNTHTGGNKLWVQRPRYIDICKKGELAK